MGRLSFRTRLLSLNQAAAFARCLGNNARFTSVEIQTSRRATSEKRYFVTWRPANPARVQVMIDRQQDARSRRAEEQGFTVCKDTEHDFWHVHSHSSGEVYETTLEGCSCPDWQFRCKANNLACKHQLAAALAIGRGEVAEFEPVPSKRQPITRDLRWVSDNAAFAEVFGP
jgi:hypothetical protein